MRYELRFQPAHALALWLSSAASVADFPAGSPEIARYLRGEALSGSQSGWTLLTASGLSLGWVKGALKTTKDCLLHRPACTFVHGFWAANRLPMGVVPSFITHSIPM